MLATQFLYIATVELIPDSPISQRHLGVFPAGDIVNATAHTVHLCQHRLTGWGKQ
ncbi:hypothetical protein D3C77_589450 [compost metagenome]